jgi:hypothetical protein
MPTQFWLSHSQVYKAYLAGISRKVAKERVVGRATNPSQRYVRRVEFALVLSLSVVWRGAILPTVEQTIREVIIFAVKGHGNK